jgi:hypothetical protein
MKRKREKTQPKKATRAPSITLHVEVFDIEDRPGPLTAGWYWQCRQYQLLRGPFQSRKAAKTDCDRFGSDLVFTILDKNAAEPVLGSRQRIDPGP